MVQSPLKTAFDSSTSSFTGSEAVVRALETDIVLGRLLPRERLVEQVLTERFWVSRAVIRAAFAALERKNLIIRRPNAGVSVVSLAPAEVEELYEARAAVQLAAIRATRFPIPDDLIAELVAIQSEHSEAVCASDLERVFRTNIRFHCVQYTACRNRYLVDTIEELSAKSYPVRSYSHTDPVILDAAQSIHWKMIDAMRTGDRALLEALCIEHLRPSRDAYVRACRLRFGERSD